ncbi:hypothetical protein SpCBS45565_g03135 [Spizellomyces sp. 'palustris']|nr:hypothetical protein SpCBS45565_g03135 [Spizellomyces sp. 'palustris']
MARPLFQLESTVPFPLPASPTTIATYKHINSAFRIVFCSIPGPLCSAAIVVPTLGEGDEGLAHTLEHLVFCGSRGIPHRGYLDSLATRCLSTGTNAYTSEDHTAYTITTAGSEGMLEVLPVFLEHILYPTLRDAQFVTEVYHLDGEAKHQGVVYCEMAGRENTESDMLDLALRRLLFQNQTTYSRECGGLTKDIKLLNNDQIIDYHKRYYHLDNLTAIICGQVQPEAVFDKIASMPGLLDGMTGVPKGTAQMPVIVVPPLPGKQGDLITETVRFPSSDEEMGSIAYGWRGPPSEDIFTIVALDVLFRFLQETSASPFAQAFVERSDPFASQVDFELRGYVNTAIELVFSGVPCRTDGDNEAHAMDVDEFEEDDSDYSEDDSEEDSVVEDEEHAPRTDLFESGVYHGLVMNVLKDAIEKKLSVPDAMRSSLARHRRKILEALEEEPHDSVAMYLVSDVVRHFLASGSTLKDTRAEGGVPVIGTRAKILSIVNELGAMPMNFWSDLARRWLIDAPMVEVQMIPDRELADEHSRREAEEQRERVEAIGPAGLEILKAKVEAAVNENKVNLPEELVATMPPVPDVTKAARLKGEMEILPFPNSADGTSRPFETCQVVQTETVFVHLRMAFNTSDLPDDLRPYLVLFQELIFQTPLVFPGPKGEDVTMDYREVVRKSADLFVSYEAALGFGNDLWSASWLSEVFMISASAEDSKWEYMIRFLCQALIFATFTEERVLTTAKNLLSEIVEVKRDGPDMLAAVSGRITIPVGSKAKDAQRNDGAISIFTQEGFLKDVVQNCKEGKVDVVLEGLGKVKECLLKAGVANGPGFAQIAVPVANERGADALVSEVAKIWDEEVQKLLSSQAPKSENGVSTAPEIQSAFPFPRKAYDAALADRTFGNAVLVPIPGVNTTFFSQIVPCDVLQPHPHPDYFAVTLLAELLTRSEGPLYTAIRGKGYAYDASVHISLWTGQLSFELYESSEPRRALLAFYSILTKLGTPVGFDEICSQFNLETARASVAYKAASSRATSGGVVVSDLRAVLRGFKTLEEEEAFHQRLYAVTRDDLRRVYADYFMRFFDVDRRITVATTAPGASAEAMRESFGMVPNMDETEAITRENIDKWVINFKETSLDELVIA